MKIILGHFQRCTNFQAQEKQGFSGSRNSKEFLGAKNQEDFLA
jgi:hypothetical protein